MYLSSDYILQAPGTDRRLPAGAGVPKRHLILQLNWFVLAVLFLLICFPVAVQASPGKTRIDDFDVKISVRENNTYLVRQQLHVTFSDEGDQHGIYEQIELHPHVYFIEDDEFYERNYRIDVSNVEVNAPFETYTEDGKLYLRIGREDTIVDGTEQDYAISFDYDAGDDGFDDFDMFYYALVGNDWQLPIENVEFEIEMPKDFDAEELGFSVGSEGQEGYNPRYLTFSVHGQTIQGSLNEPLPPYEGLWVRLGLPAGYFVGARTEDMAVMSVVWISIAAAVAMTCLYLFRKKSSKALISAQFRPPPGLTPADVGYIVDGIVADRDVVALLIYWAALGSLKIVEMAPDHPGSKNTDMLFVKLRELPQGASDYEQLMFDALFENDSRVSTKNLQSHFYKTIAETKKRIRRRFSSDPHMIFQPFSDFLSDVCCGLAALPAALMGAVVSWYSAYEIQPPIFVGVLLFVLGYILSRIYCDLRRRWQSEKTVVRKRTLLVTAAAALIYCIALYGSGAEVFGLFGLIPITCSLVLAWLAPRFVRRTELGESLSGQLAGLRYFIEQGSQPRIEMLERVYPDYFYEILPYAYVMGVSDIWSSRFANIAVQPPAWYAGSDGSSTFTTVYFTQNLDRAINRTSSAMTAESGSASASGGGFSGGGFGGSGGGTW